MTNEIVDMIRNSVIVKPKAAVYISGGVDSTIILHHLIEKSSEQIRTYTARFGVEEDECIKAEKIARHYGTNHKVVDVGSFLAVLRKTMGVFKQPRYNVWPYWLAKEAKIDGVENVYIGEGGDEHFGGYADRGFLDAWANQITTIKSTYVEIHEYFDINLEMPFHDLDIRDTLEYYRPPRKELLVEAYKDLLPKAVVSSPPAFSNKNNYVKLWEKEVKKYFPRFEPKSLQDIRDKFQELAIYFWYEQNKLEDL